MAAMSKCFFSSCLMTSFARLVKLRVSIVVSHKLCESFNLCPKSIPAHYFNQQVSPLRTSAAPRVGAVGGLDCFLEINEPT